MTINITKEQAELLDNVLIFLKNWDGKSIEFKQYKEEKDNSVDLDKIRNAFSFAEYYQRDTGHRIFARNNDWIDKWDGLSYFLDAGGFGDIYKKQQIEQERNELDTKLKKLTISATKFTRNVTYLSLAVALVGVVIPVIIWVFDSDKVQKTKTEVPQLEQVLKVQQKIQENLQDVQKNLQTLDTSVKKVLILKK